MQHVALVLRPVGAPQEPVAAGVARRPHVVAGRDEVDPELVRPPQERPELDLAVAARTRVRRPTLAELVHEVVDHRPVEIVRQVADLEREPGDPRHLGGVRPGRRAAASVLDPVEVHERHVRAPDVVALFPEQAGGDRGVDAPGHRDEDGGLHPPRLPRCPSGRGSGVARAARIVCRMIEARFDDLTGAEPSFRLVEPVGVLEATRTEEVVGVLEAADAAAARGLWVAGMVAYEAAPGLDPALRVRRRPLGDPFAELPLAWFAMFEGRQETTLPEPPAGAAPGASVWEPSVDRSRVRRGHRADPRSHRRRRHVPGQLHAAPARPGRRRSPRPLPGPVLRPARALRRLPRPRPLPGAVRVAGALLPPRRRPHRDEADEGHGPAGSVARGRRGQPRAPPRLGEGPGGERDDRRPAAQRRRPHRAEGLGHVGGRVRDRTVRHGLAADLDGRRRARRRGLPSPTSSARCSRPAA